jgi:AcrR family transcriptional regulator
MTTKEKIRDTAFDLISVYGYAGTSIRNIAGKVGIRESAIYNHFKSKEEIFAGILDYYKNSAQGVELLTEDLLDELQYPEKFLKLFSGKLLTVWSHENEQKFIRVIMKEQFNLPGKFAVSLSEILSEMKTVWIMIFSQMIKYGYIKKADPELLANEYLAPLFFIRIKYLSELSPAQLKPAIKEVNQHIEFFWNAIGK